VPKKKGRSGHPGGIKCPDCGQRSVRQQLVHDPTCPAARALDGLMIQDADWFAARPDARHRCRWITTAELMELPTVADRKLSPKSVIHIEQLQPGIRQRSILVPGDEVIQPSMLGLFGHSSTFTLLEASTAPLPPTHTGVLPSDLQVRLFALPAGDSADELVSDLDGLIVLRPGDALPVPLD
jgi:hypothetical protein